MVPDCGEKCSRGVPVAQGDAVTNGVRSVSGFGAVAGGTAVHVRCSNDRADDFSRGVENQSVPEIAGDGFLALAAFADDGLLYGIGDAVRGFV